MAKKKRNYRAELKAASDFADTVMDGHRLPRAEWLQMWGVIFDARLAQIRHPNTTFEIRAVKRS